MKFKQTQQTPAGANSGCATAQCGKAEPFRKNLLPFDERLRLDQLTGGIASVSESEFVGEAEPHRTVLRQSRCQLEEATKLRRYLLAAMILIAICRLAPATGFAQQPAIGRPTASQTSPANQPDDRYRIGPGDVLDIRILNRPQLSRDTVRVEGNGMIRMPLIEGEIRAACRSEGELAKEIAQGYLKFYRNPQVDVFIKEYHARQVAVMGAVIEPARFEMKQRYRLLDLLSYAKGPSDKAGQIVNIVRGPKMSVCEGQAADVDDGSDALLSIKLSDTMSGLESANPYVRAGDIITIPEADQVYVVGNVYTPKTLPLKEPMTVSRAIAMAGGPLQDSKTSRIKVLRQEPGSTTKTELYVDLGAIAKKRAEDLALRPNDIIEVPTSTGKSLLRSLLGSVAPSIAQLPVRVIP